MIPHATRLVVVDLLLIGEPVLANDTFTDGG